MNKLVITLFLTIGLSQTTFTDEEMVNLENQFIQLEFQVDSLSTIDSLKTLELKLLYQEIELLKQDIILSEQKTKLVKPSWYENKWLYFGYGTVLSYAVITIGNQIKQLAIK